MRPPTQEELYKVGEWRLGCRESLRTVHLPSPAYQVHWFNSLDNREHRYWWIPSSAFGGLTYISWENRTAEISLIVDPAERRKGDGRRAVDALLKEGFGRMNLHTITGEVYHCNPAREFWDKVIHHYQADTAILPHRKYWGGQYYDSTFFSIRG